MNVQSTEMRRYSLTRKIMQSIASGDVRPSMPVRTEDGRCPIVVALPNENMSEVVARANAAGPRVNLVVAYAKKFRVLEMGKLSAAVEPIDAATDEINKGLSLGMFLLKLDQRDTDGATFRFRNVGVNVPGDAREFAYA